MLTKVQIDTSKKLFRKEYENFKLSLRITDYEDLLESMRINVTLKRLTQQSIKLEPHRTKRMRSNIPDFTKIQKCAQSTYSALRSYFNCTCHTPHAASIQLEPQLKCTQANGKIQTSANRIRVLFLYSCDIPTPDTTPWKLSVVEIEQLEDRKQPRDLDQSPPVVLPNQGKKRVQISLPRDEIPVPSLIEHSNLKPIPNPCSVLSGLHQANHGACIGYLLDETTNNRHRLFPAMNSPVLRDQYTFTTLRQVLSPKGNAAP